MRARNINVPSVSARRLPQRTCIACRTVRAKPDLIRLVRTKEGNLEIDTTGKKAGRGAYLCPVRECWEAGLKSKQLEHALRGQFSKEDKERLLKSARELFKGDNQCPG